MQHCSTSHIPFFTVYDDPKDAVVSSHKLLIRGGFIRKQASGLYVLLPFANIIQNKIESIIRDELNKAGCIEVKLPVLSDSELWQKSGRWSVMGKEMFRQQDRHNHLYALGPTHEESMTWLAQQFLKSYKQLPVNFYQIGTKYRDEIRPRYGLIRCREFVMKDGYSFHLDEESLDQSYQSMREAYRNIFQRCGLETIAVEADSGAMGGSQSEEFMVASSIGEETILYYNESEPSYSANQEKAEFIPVAAYPSESSGEAIETDTPNTTTIEELVALLKKDKRLFIKAVIYENTESVVISFIPGDREANLHKIQAATGETELEMASADTIEVVTGASPGYAGPANLPFKDGEKIKSGNDQKTVKILYDRNLKGRSGLVSGSNKNHTHTLNLQEGRDFTIPTEQDNLDLVLAEEGDIVPGTKDKKLVATKGIEVGHIFKLGKKYTDAFDLNVLDKNGKPSRLIMGTYGIGVGRTIATIVEQNHDEKGIIWPASVAPFHIMLTGIFKNEEQKASVDRLYQKLVENKIAVFYDDRFESPGTKFADAELTGFPWQIIAGKSFQNEGKLELKIRRTGEKQELTLEQLIEQYNKSF